MKTIVDGTIIKKYEVPIDMIDELNQEYEKNKNSLHSNSEKLAGRLEIELSILSIIQKLKIFKKINFFINDYMMTLNNFGLLAKPQIKTNITSCWINDMKEGEYNPVHTHNGPTNDGWSCVLFLKVPEFVNDVKHKHKFHDGQLCFLGYDKRMYWITPEVGDFYLFQADQQHTVYPFKTKIKGQVRRSMSFNLIIETDAE
jgi:hypothetical protein|tara:strand:- start:1606 stop:2205 length:600 start_codon:yes stop_codon:yes gene_type:complete